jgi:hypothetical protein
LQFALEGEEDEASKKVADDAGVTEGVLPRPLESPDETS